jgi:pimeloyl-ACP methyl ester carboxylesterase
MPQVEINEHAFTVDGHTTAYLAAGPEDGPLMVFVHGWPELSWSWRHQLPVFGGLGFRAIAPDMRGYGRSSVYAKHEAYAQEHVVGDMMRLLDHLGRHRAIWVGHDWGSPVVWSVASHHPDRCPAVASLCVPYGLERGLDAILPLVDRSVYPEAQYPVGQWDYQLYYQENFDRATAVMDADASRMAKALFRRGNPQGQGKPAVTASIRAQGGWFGGADRAPDVPMDPTVVSDEDLQRYAESLSRNGFAGPNAWYMNHEANAEYAGRAVKGGELSMPVLFLAARYDYVCESVVSDLARPMRDECHDLEVVTIDSGHWMAQEKPFEVNACLANWLVRRVPSSWPVAVG